MKQLSLKAHAAAFHAEFFGNTTQQRYVVGINEYANAVAAKANLNGFIDDSSTAKEHLGKPIVKPGEVPPGSMVISTESAEHPKTAMNKLLRLNGVVSMDYVAVADASQGKLPQVKAIADTQKEHAANPDKFEWVRELLADQESREVFNRVMEFRLNANLRAMRFFDYTADQPYTESFLNTSSPALECVDPKALEGMSKHIQQQHPSLAVPVWHDPAHFWQAPKIVLGAREEYSVYLRHYSEGWTGTVMFFIPR